MYLRFLGAEMDERICRLFSVQGISLFSTTICGCNQGTTDLVPSPSVLFLPLLAHNPVFRCALNAGLASFQLPQQPVADRASQVGLQHK